MSGVTALLPLTARVRERHWLIHWEIWSLHCPQVVSWTNWTLQLQDMTVSICSAEDRHKKWKHGHYLNQITSQVQSLQIFYSTETPVSAMHESHFYKQEQFNSKEGEVNKHWLQRSGGAPKGMSTHTSTRTPTSRCHQAIAWTLGPLSTSFPQHVASSSGILPGSSLPA